MRILITGANGFIGSNLIYRLLHETEHEVVAVDLGIDKLDHSIGHERLFVNTGDFTKIDDKSLYTLIGQCDLIMHLIAIANPGIYITDPLRVFKLDFLENMRVIAAASALKKRIIHFSTSEVYGKNPKLPYNELTSDFVLGPISSHRWIYSSCKQLLDRVIHAYGMEENGFQWTIVRPFNFIGPKLDYLREEKEGNPRVICHFMDALMKGEPIKLVNGGNQKRCFVYIRDAIDCFLKIIENDNGICDNEIINIGNPDAELSIKELAYKMKEIFDKNHRGDRPESEIIEESGEEFYGKGYEDTERRVPDISRAKLLLDWEPKVGIDEMLKRTVNYYCGDYVDYYRREEND